MATAVVSGRIPEDMRDRVSAKAGKMGMTINDLIAGACRYVDTHDDIPWAQDQKGGAAAALAELREIVADMPTGTPLSTMTASDIKKELANRG